MKKDLVRFLKILRPQAKRAVWATLLMLIVVLLQLPLVGKSGAGKTTLCNLLLRFIEPRHGDITVDGITIEELDIRSLRENIAIVPQEIYLFSGRILVFCLQSSVFSL